MSTENITTAASARLSPSLPSAESIKKTLDETVFSYAPEAGALTVVSEGPKALAPFATVSFVVNLPLTTQVIATQVFTTAGGPDGDHELRLATSSDFNWFHIRGPVYSSTPTNLTVTYTMYNESHNRTRYARVDVHHQQ